MPYHYTESGLSFIFLKNGWQEVETKYGPGIIIDNIEGLHAAIGRSLINTPRRLKGEEIRFLRKELDLSQTRLALLLGSSEQTVSLWERDSHPIDKTADKLLRAVYAEFLGCHEIRKLIEELGTLDDAEQVLAYFEEQDRGWIVAA